MSFSPTTKSKAFAASGRRCCLCGVICGIHLEAHHIVPKEQGGTNRYANCIPLCYRCHAEVGHYNKKHPRGNKFTPEELRTHRDRIYRAVAERVLDSESLNRPPTSSVTASATTTMRSIEGRVIKKQHLELVATRLPTDALDDIISAYFAQSLNERRGPSSIEKLVCNAALMAVFSECRAVGLLEAGGADFLLSSGTELSNSHSLRHAEAMGLYYSQGGQSCGRFIFSKLDTAARIVADFAVRHRHLFGLDSLLRIRHRPGALKVICEYLRINPSESETIINSLMTEKESILVLTQLLSALSHPTHTSVSTVLRPTLRTEFFLRSPLAEKALANGVAVATLSLLDSDSINKRLLSALRTDPVGDPLQPKLARRYQNAVSLDLKQWDNDIVVVFHSRKYLRKEFIGICWFNGCVGIQASSGGEVQGALAYARFLDCMSSLQPQEAWEVIEILFKNLMLSEPHRLLLLAGFIEGCHSWAEVPASAIAAVKGWSETSFSVFRIGIVNRLLALSPPSTFDQRQYLEELRLGLIRAHLDSLPDSERSTINASELQMPLEIIDPHLLKRYHSFEERVSFFAVDKVLVFYAKNKLGRDFFAYILCDVCGAELMREHYHTQTASMLFVYGDVLRVKFAEKPTLEDAEWLTDWLSNPQPRGSNFVIVVPEDFE